jgi:hypothetical protein
MWPLVRLYFIRWLCRYLREAVEPEPHLVNAALTLERILNARDDGLVYTVSVRPRVARPVDDANRPGMRN